MAVTNVSETGARITWTTDEDATGKVYYSTTSPVNTATAPSLEATTRGTGHAFDLSGLSRNTTYYFVIESKDAMNNRSTSVGVFWTE